LLRKDPQAPSQGRNQKTLGGSRREKDRPPPHPNLGAKGGSQSRGKRFEEAKKPKEIPPALGTNQKRIIKNLKCPAGLWKKENSGLGVGDPRESWKGKREGLAKETTSPIKGKKKDPGGRIAGLSRKRKKEFLQ